MEWAYPFDKDGYCVHCRTVYYKPHHSSCERKKRIVNNKVVLWSDVPDEQRWTPDTYRAHRRRIGYPTGHYLELALAGFYYPDCRAATKTEGKYKPCLMPTHDDETLCKVHRAKQLRLQFSEEIHQ